MSDWDEEDDVAHYDPTSFRRMDEALTESLMAACAAFCRDTDRDQTLAGLPYAEYLRTDHWREMRQVMLLRAGRQCQRCEASNVQLDVHHLTYDRLGREAERDLIVLCRRCHAREHGDTVERCPRCMQHRIGTGRCWYCGGTEP